MDIVRPTGLTLVLVIAVAACGRGGDPGSGGVPAGAATRPAADEVAPSGRDVEAAGGGLTTDGYADPASCGGCHVDLAASYRSVAMAQSFRRVAPDDLALDDGHGNRVVNAASGFIYEIRRDEGRLIQRRFERDRAGRAVRVFEREATFVMGSGRHARTFVRLAPTGEMTELPVTWYQQEKAWAMSPGYDRPDQPDFFRTVTYSCLFCHDAYPAVPRGTDSPVAPQLFPQELPAGIDCQRCHGPGARHVRLARSPAAPFAEVRASIVNPARLTPERRMDICMECHLESTSVGSWSGLLVFGRGVFSFRPGEDLAGYIRHFDHPREAGLGGKFEIAGQAYRLRQATCFKASGGRLTCTTCHDPHRRPENPGAYFSSKCLGCHRREQCTPGAHAAAQGRLASDCVSCHMPPRRTEDAVHIVMTDHLIGRAHPSREERLAPRREPTGKYRGPIAYYRPEEIPAGPEADLALGVASIVDDVDLDRGLDLLRRGLASAGAQAPEPYLQRGLTLQSLGRMQEARADLERAAQLSPGNARILLALGNALAELGKENDALARYDQAIAAWPAYSEAHTNAGNLLARAGRLEEALARYDKAIALLPENARAHGNRGAILARLGRPAEAEAALNESLRIAPAGAEAAANLADVLVARGDEAGAAGTLRDGVKRNPAGASLLARLAWILATTPDGALRDGKDALERAQRAVALTGRGDARALDALAAALAETGRPAEADRQAAEAQRLAAAAGQGDLAAAIAARRGIYRGGGAYRRTAVAR